METAKCVHAGRPIDSHISVSKTLGAAYLLV